MEPEKEFQDREDKRKQLFLNQKQLLDTFLEHGAISQTQYDKSLGPAVVSHARKTVRTVQWEGRGLTPSLYPIIFYKKNFYKIIKKVLTNEITYAIMLPETRERTIDHRR